MYEVVITFTSGLLKRIISDQLFSYSQQGSYTIFRTRSGTLAGQLGANQEALHGVLDVYAFKTDDIDCFIVRVTDETQELYDAQQKENSNNV